MDFFMGLLRLVLALSVVAGHTRSTVFGFDGLGATYVVPVFFAISGFYMAMILNEKYANLSPTKFYISRSLRIFPIYFIGATLALLISYHEIITTFNELTHPSKLYMLISNIFIFGSDLTNQFCFHTKIGSCETPINLSINPPGWSLAPELMFYLAAPFVVKSAGKTVAMLCAGCVYFIIANRINYPISEFGVYSNRSVPFVYSFYAASIVFFSIGSLGYHLVKRGVRLNYYIAMPLIVLLSYTQTTVPSWVILFLGLSVPALFEITKNIKIDRFIGELSYPVYILHFPIYIFMKNNNINSGLISLGTMVSILTIAISLIAHFLVDKKVDSFRHSNKVINVIGERSEDSKLGVSYALLYALTPIIWVALLVSNQ